MSKYDTWWSDSPAGAGAVAQHFVGRLATAVFLAAMCLTGAPAAGQRAAPELRGDGGWLNTGRDLHLATDLKGQVVAVHFWTAGDLRSALALPALRACEEQFATEPFLVVCVHTPALLADRDRRFVRDAA